MSIKYSWRMIGGAANRQTWVTTGEVEVEGPGQFREALEQAQADSFIQLTQGKARYGRPGVGCQGPYRILKFTIMELSQVASLQGLPSTES